MRDTSNVIKRILRFSIQKNQQLNFILSHGPNIFGQTSELALMRIARNNHDPVVGIAEVGSGSKTE